MTDSASITTQDPLTTSREFTRCEHCRMQNRLCICSSLPKISTKCRLVLIIHHKEMKRPSNTGLLATQCLLNSEIIVRGKPGAPIESSGLSHLGDYEPIWLFPSPEAHCLDSDFVSTLEKPVALLVPDGNWGQAARIPRRVNTPFPAKKVFLPLTSPSEYRLRRELGRAEGLGTIEAIARAIAIIEGNDEICRQMTDIMRLMVNRTLWSRGMISHDQAKAFLPEPLNKTKAFSG